MGLFPGTPAIVVAAGPSLDANLSEIRRNRGNAVVIAVDTALRPLLSAGVEPDLVVAVDPSESNANHLVDLPACEFTFLVAEGSLDPEALVHFSGRTFFFKVADHHPWPWLRAAGIERGRLRAWGSVLTTGFDLALTMGCSPIVFAGADLAFTGGRPYARGTSYEEVWSRELAWGRSLDDVFNDRVAHWPMAVERSVDGCDVRTAPHLRSFRDWIVTEAAAFADRTIVNATPGGILAGRPISHASIDDVLASSRQIGVRERILAAHARAVRHGVASTRSVPHETRAQWSAFASLPLAAIEAALAPAATPKTGAPPAAATTAPPGDSDQEFLARLRASCSVKTLVVRGAEQDVLAELRATTAELQSSEAVAVVDESGHSRGAQVRAALDALLCERLDLGLDDRRFTLPSSRLSVVRRVDQRATLQEHADAVKWDPNHRPIAAKLAPLVARALRPSSVLDIGCGAGFWLEALAAAGVSDVRGITDREQGRTPTNIGVGALTDPALIERRYDAVLCLEVIQRLPLEDHDRVIQQCVRASDTVVFSSQMPGAPGASPLARPLSYWAAKFFEHGYVLDDALRPMLEARADHPDTVYDCLVVFRRTLAVEQVRDAGVERAIFAMTARTQELFAQRVWWATLATTPATPLPTPPQSATVRWTVPFHRMAPASEGKRVVKFRTSAARWFVTHHAAALSMSENDQPLESWSRWRDEVTFGASDGSDPRTNGRAYAIGLPQHVAWAESQPWADVMSHGL